MAAKRKLTKARKTVKSNKGKKAKGAAVRKPQRRAQKPQKRPRAAVVKAAAKRPRAAAKESKNETAHMDVVAMATAYWTSQCLFVASKLGVADLLVKGALSAEAIAEKIGVHGPSLQRVLRALVSLGVFTTDRKGRIALTAMSEVLRSDHPQSARAFVNMIVEDWNWQAWGALLPGVKDGVSPFDHALHMPVFAYLQQHPAYEQGFAEAMASISVPQNTAVAQAYPFGKLKKLVDVGGAHGHLLAAILRAHPKLNGVLYDQPQVVAGAASSGYVNAPDLAGRCTIEGGDFFESVPAGADGYIMKYIIHDWDDAKCIKILSHCRKAMAPQGRVLVVDAVVAPGNERDPAKFMDINMLVGPGGKERTRAEFAQLFADAGLKLKRIIPATPVVSILEAVPD